MVYHSTRDKELKRSSCEAIIKGLSPEGGLFVPEEIPVLEQGEMEELVSMTYQERAVRILGKFLTDFTEEELKDCVSQAYTKEKFGTSSIAPLYKLDSHTYILELWHGPTCAFKDMALQILPHFLVTAMKKQGIKKEVVILVATSGDTGKAALDGFADVQGTRINVFYPNDGVSRIQKLQMVTQTGNNVNVTAVNGNFDDAQNGVKRIFTDREFGELAANHNFLLSSANSINWGRLAPQIVYYLSAYADMIRSEEIENGAPVNIVVPTGNFGNILAAFYAYQMGLPVNKFICASNCNNVLTEFINTGVYNKNREFNLTISPSMDILISSNLERFLYHASGGDTQQIKQYMSKLASQGSYAVSEQVKAFIRKIFWADFATDSETKQAIRETSEKNAYVMDTHTAVAKKVYDKYCAATGDETKTIIASTASPFKFSTSVLQALKNDDGYGADKDEFEQLDTLSKLSNMQAPQSLTGLKTKNVLFDVTCEKDEMLDIVRDFLRM